MWGRGCASLMVAALSCRKSTQKRRLPSFFFTITTSEAQGLLEGHRLSAFVGPWPFLLAGQRGFADYRADRGVVPWFRWCVAAAECSQDHPLLG